ncbi:hypothetical protein AB9E29_28185 [Rhizobium leguminosarum]|uniref:hypothetical protein n=1 Tax=Rhizobium leguminosarum TaxID=384 RepID=UPI0013DA1E35|nr:hypothetical protein [Rhizobium leguminosarum]NEK39337.1 hypothetical protein [Rhizobium leguminosarum]
MSVYKRAGKETYSYDFVVRGRRFFGDTGQTKKRDAKAFEEAQREIAKAEMAASSKLEANTMTFEIAALRWYHEIGQYHKNFETTLKVLDWLKRNIGSATSMTRSSPPSSRAGVARGSGESANPTTE